ncbi:uncharacterized protein LOC122083650 [Macadamia integrifolia]|uniref:uncharacterized protein LOC122083650 n=1 Tax=Macadamia integrifolia TaxID=60698 RepID=UPI001C4F4A9D|nr:uncharacterized protein LOC122083650 [Macadamia integrifolia]
MGFDSFEAANGSQMLEVEWDDSSLNPLKNMDIASRHKRSKSYPDKRLKEELRRLKMDMSQGEGHAEPKENQSKLGVQSSLKQEILQLEKRLQDQFVVRGALEKALGYSSSYHDISNDNSMPKPAKELIKEIAVLEMEVVYWEQYLLSLYRKAFDQQISDLCPSTMDERVKSPSFTKKDMFLKISGLDISSERENLAVQSSRFPLNRNTFPKAWKDFSDVQGAKKLLDSGIHLSHSSLCHRSACSTVTPLPMEAWAWKDFNKLDGAKKLLDSGIHRSHSSLCHRSACSTVTPLPTETQALKDFSNVQGAKKLLDSGIHRSHSSLGHRSACSMVTPPMETQAWKDFGDLQGAKKLLYSSIHLSHSSLCHRSACSAVTPLPTKTQDVEGAKKLLDSGIHRSHSSLSHRSACSMTTPPMETQAWKDFIDVQGAKKLLDSGIHRSHSSLCHRSACSTTSPPTETLDRASRALRACHSQPLSLPKNATSNVISLAEHLGTSIADHVPETPNRISEDMIKCMTAIYCKLAEPPLMHDGLSSSPISSLSLGSAFSPRDQNDLWSPRHRKDSPFDALLDNPLYVEGKEFSGPYSTMVEVPRICRDNQKLSESKDMLQNFRSLVCRLEEVDPRKMRHEEKLAFWVNVHNALVMHAFLACGIPQNNMKRVSLLLKAAYNVGGHSISADTIQSFILGCRMPRPGQWFRSFFPTKTKFKAGDYRQAYAIERPEPLLHFGLCSGSHSDPAVRVYTPKRVFQELEAAKEEYIWATYGVRKEQKLILPKIVESYVKDNGLSPSGVVEMIQQCIPESLMKTTIHKSQNGKTSKSIEWVPHNFAFRYLLSKELVK